VVKAKARAKGKVRGRSKAVAVAELEELREGLALAEVLSFKLFGGETLQPMSKAPHARFRSPSIRGAAYRRFRKVAKSR
jgi:hypothetical protein